jgi:hypothetical protein
VKNGIGGSNTPSIPGGLAGQIFAVGYDAWVSSIWAKVFICGFAM